MSKELKVTSDKVDNYQLLISIIKAEIETEKDYIANLSNISAYFMALVKDISWVGFYILKGGELVLGPFQGKAACTRIKLGNGVCGKAAKDETLIRVDNVHEFPSHIACDSDSNSEIVIPIFKNSILVGVLDIDSTSLERFKELEEEYFAKAALEIEGCGW
ncbi:MAG TPA: GAF domain-containing protein [Clostridiaceae bacterium]